MSTNPLTRRDLLKAGAAALTLPIIVPAHVLGLGGTPLPVRRRGSASSAAAAGPRVSSPKGAR